MALSIDQVLEPKVILREITRLKMPNTTLSNLFGWGLPARDPKAQMSNMYDHPLRFGQYDVYNRSRRVATARAPGQVSARIAPQKVGTVNFTVPRIAETIALTHEDLRNRRVIGGSMDTIDSRGMYYIQKQEEFLADRVANAIEFQTAAMLRGSYSYDQVGDDIHQCFSGGQTTIDYQIPAGNKSQLDMLGDGDLISASWASADTDIPGQLLAIRRAMIQLNGWDLKHVLCGSEIWNYVVNNTKVHTQGGSVERVFDVLKPADNDSDVFVAVLRGIPWLTWHIIDNVLEVWNASTEAYTLQPVIPANSAVFLPDPDRSWATYINGTATVTEGPNGVPTDRAGFYPYAYSTFDPSGWNLCVEHNGLPELDVPSCIAVGEVVYT